MRVAVVGAGINGLVCAYVLAKAGVNVVLYEKEDYLGGVHAKTIVNTNGFDLDLEFMLLNSVTYPNIMEFFESLGVDMKLSYLSISVSLDNGQGYEWGSRNGLSSLFAQKRNVLNPYFWQMIREVIKFKEDVLSYLDILKTNPNIDRDETLGQFIKSKGYTELFQKAYLIPLCCSIWPCTSEAVMRFSTFSVLSFFRDHHLLQLFDHSQCRIVRWNTKNYIEKVKEELVSKNCQIKANCEVHLVSTYDKGCVVLCEDGSQEMYDGCIMAIHAHNALRILGDGATSDECRILGAFQYVYSDIFLHRDKNLMPQNPTTWSAWNFLGTTNNSACVTYWLNILQNINGETSLPFLITLNPDQRPKNTLLKWSTTHLVPTVAASKASYELDHIQGKRKIWFSGAYHGYGYHGNGLKAGMDVAHAILGRCCALQSNPKYMVPSWTEAGARLFVTRFLSSYITTGCVMLLEDGGTIFTFEGPKKNCSLKSVLRIHNPQFYWKVMTHADLGLACAYMDGDFSFVDTDKGLLNFILILIANNDLNASHSNVKKNRGWWTLIFFMGGLESIKLFIKHVSTKNSLTQAHKNICMHYDLSNELFTYFMDETMQYSCGVFKNEDEDLKDAQIRKMSMLIEKAKIDRKHEILEIGCGWGGFAIEVVKQTGCKYTGISLSEEQLKYAEDKVKDAGLQDHITFHLCDYRQLPKAKQYDRIIACEMIEHVGHDYMEEFFGCCDSALADDGLLVLQFISVRDESYDEYRRGPSFIKEYFFPGSSAPCLSRVTSAMAAATKLCVEHVEDIGTHYYQTLRWWRKNFIENHSKIQALGFDEKFLRKWEYYFDYCAAGFKARLLWDYQVVFSRPASNNPATLAY